MAFHHRCSIKAWKPSPLLCVIEEDTSFIFINWWYVQSYIFCSEFASHSAWTPAVDERRADLSGMQRTLAATNGESRRNSPMVVFLLSPTSTASYPMHMVANREYRPRREEERAFPDILFSFILFFCVFVRKRQSEGGVALFYSAKKAYAFVIYCVLGRHLASTLNLKKAEQ